MKFVVLSGGICGFAVAGATGSARCCLISRAALAMPRPSAAPTFFVTIVPSSKVTVPFVPQPRVPVYGQISGCVLGQ